MAIEGILSSTLSQAGASPAALAEAAEPQVPPSSRGGAVSLSRDRIAVAAGGRFAGEIAALDRGRANATTALSLVAVADEAFADIDAKLTRMKALAAQAASVKLESTDPTPPNTSRLERTILDTEFARLRAEIDTIANGTTFDGLAILTGGGGGGTLNLNFNVGGDSEAADVITVSIEAGTVANLDSGLAAANLLTVTTANAALTDVNAGIDKVKDARAGLRGAAVRLYGAASSAAGRAYEVEGVKDDKQAIRVLVDVAQLVAERVADDRGIDTILHDTELLRQALVAFALTAGQGPAARPTPAASGTVSGARDTGVAPGSFGSFGSGGAFGSFASGGPGVSGGASGLGGSGAGRGAKVDAAA